MFVPGGRIFVWAAPSPENPLSAAGSIRSSLISSPSSSAATSGTTRCAAISRRVGEISNATLSENLGLGALIACNGVLAVVEAATGNTPSRLITTITVASTETTFLVFICILLYTKLYLLDLRNRHYKKRFVSIRVIMHLLPNHRLRLFNLISSLYTFLIKIQARICPTKLHMNDI